MINLPTPTLYRNRWRVRFYDENHLRRMFSFDTEMEALFFIKTHVVEVYETKRRKQNYIQKLERTAKAAANILKLHNQETIKSLEYALNELGINLD